MNYNYFIVPSLAEITWDNRPEYTMQEFIESNSDIFEPYKDGVNKIVLLYELKNIELVLKSKIDQPEGYKGNDADEFNYFSPAILPINEIESFVDDPISFAPEEYPDSIIEFFEKYKDNLDRYNRIDELYSEYLDFDEYGDGFFNYFFSVMSVARTVLQALRINRLDLNLEEYLTGNEDVINTILEHRSSSDFGLSVQYRFVADIVSVFESNPLDLEIEIDKILHNAVREYGEDDLFGDHMIYSFLIGLFIFDRWMQMNEELGNEFIENILRP